MRAVSSKRPEESRVRIGAVVTVSPGRMSKEVITPENGAVIADGV